jgi:hypothetical protein
MQHKPNNKLIVKVLIIGVVIAILSFLFHPGAGQLSIMLNGEPVADPLVRFAAVPTVISILILTAVMTVLLFLGVGVLMFLFAMFIALIGILIMAPYFWPVRVIMLLMMALMVVGNGSKD